LVDDPVNALNVLGGRKTPLLKTQVTPSRFYFPADLAYAAMMLRELLLNNRMDRQFNKLPSKIKQSAVNLQSLATDCSLLTNEQAVHDALQVVSKVITPYLTRVELTAIWQKLKDSPCASQFTVTVANRIDLNIAIANGQSEDMSRLAGLLLENNIAEKDQILFAGVLGYLGQGNRQQAQQLWNKYVSSVNIDEKTELLARLLNGHSASSH
jgi:hypothetical protein